MKLDEFPMEKYDKNKFLSYFTIGDLFNFFVYFIII